MRQPLSVKNCSEAAAAGCEGTGEASGGAKSMGASSADDTGGGPPARRTGGVLGARAAVNAAASTSMATYFAAAATGKDPALSAQEGTPQPRLPFTSVAAAVAATSCRSSGVTDGASLVAPGHSMRGVASKTASAVAKVVSSMRSTSSNDVATGDDFRQESLRRQVRSVSMTNTRASPREPVTSVYSGRLARRATEVPRSCELAHLADELDTKSLDKKVVDKLDARGIVDVQDALDLTETAFEINHMGGEDPSTQMYTFKRSAKHSVMLDLGMVPRHRTSLPVPNAGSDVFGPYSHASERTCTVMYMAVVIGDGMFNISRGMAKCGWIPGLAVLWGICWIHHFLCTRFVEVPQLLERNFETYTSVARHCFGRIVSPVFAWFCIQSWAGNCTISLRNIAKACRMVLFKDQSTPVGISFFFCIFLTPFAFRTSARGLHLASLVAFSTMLSIATLESMSAMYRVFGSTESVTYTLVGSRQNVICGAQDIAMAFAGVGMLPYIVAEMFSPAEAHRVVSTACQGISSLYTIVAIVCYFGWGNDVMQRAPIQEVMNQGPGGLLLSRFIFGLLGIRTVMSYGIFFWPMWREMGRFLNRQEEPASELRLPWAIRFQYRIRTWARIGLVALTWAPLGFTRQHYFFYREFFIKMPNLLVHFVFPALLAVVAICSHSRRLMLQPPTRELSSMTLKEAPTEIMYFGGNIRVHVASTFVFAAVIVSAFCLMFARLCTTFIHEVLGEHT